MAVRPSAPAVAPAGPRHTRGRHVVVAVVIAALVGAGVVLHAAAIADVQRISHDDTISYLVATGHQGRYQRIVDTGVDPVARWVPAAQWQAFTRIDAVLPLVTIAQDLGHYDIHPPAYFWLLHVWSLLVGVHLWTGPVLNVALHIVAAVIMWRLARRLVGSMAAAWAVMAIWVSLPAVAQTAMATRQYSLAALWSMAVGAAFVRTRAPLGTGATTVDAASKAATASTASVGTSATTSRRGLIALSAVTALGLLTVYTFAVVVAGLGLVSLADLRIPARHRTARAQITAFAVGGAAFLACQPWVREVLARQRDQVETMRAGLPALRLGVLLRDLPRFAVSGLPVLLGVGLLIVTAVLAVLAWRAAPEARPIVVVAVWVPAVLAAFYVGVRSPGAASQARYFSVALPYVAFLPVLAWPALRAWRPVPALATAALVAAAVVNITAATGAIDTRPPATLDGDRPVVLDNLARGVLLRILWDAPPDTPVYAADQATLLATTDRWLACTRPSPCNGQPLTLATQVQYDATEVGQLRVLAVADEVRAVTREPSLDGLAERYRLSAPSSGVGAPRLIPPGPRASTDVHSGAGSRTDSTTMTSSTSTRSPDAAASISYDPDGVYPARRARYQNSVQ